MDLQTLSKSRQVWLDHIRQCEKQNLTAAEYCKKHNLVKQRFYQYKSELRKLGISLPGDKPASSFVAVKPVEHKSEIQKIKRRSFPAFNFELAIKTRLFQLQFNAGKAS